MGLDFGVLYGALLGWAVLDVVAAALWRKPYKHIAHFGFIAPLAMMAASALLKKKSQDDANKQVKGQAAAAEAYRQRMLARNAGFLGEYGDQIAGARSTSSSAMTGGGTRSTKQRKVVDKDQAGMKAALEKILGARQGQTEFVTPAERAARNLEIAATERAAREALGATAAQRGVSPGSNPSMYLPALQAASGARIQSQADWEKQNRQEGAAARAESAGFMQDWAGQDTNENFTNWQNTDTSSFDPARNLGLLYSMNMYDPGAEQKPLTQNSWLGAGSDLLGSLSQYYGSEKAPSWFGGSKSPVAALPAARSVGPQSPMPAWRK